MLCKACSRTIILTPCPYDPITAVQGMLADFSAESGDAKLPNQTKIESFLYVNGTKPLPTDIPYFLTTFPFI